MNNLRTTTVKPLMVNFITPTAADHSEPIRVIYDAQNEITYFMGGGSKKASRSNDGYKETKEKQNAGTWSHNDAERYTDD